MKSLPLFLLLAALLGAGTWFVLGSNPAVAEQPSSNSQAATDSASTDAPAESSTPASDDKISSAVERQNLEHRPADASLVKGSAPALPFEGPAATIKLRIVDGKGKPIADGSTQFLSASWNQEIAGLSRADWQEVNTLPVGPQGELTAAVPVGFGFRLKIGGAFWRSQMRTVQALQPEEVVDLGEIALTPANRIAGIVRNKEGQPLAKAWIKMSETNGSMWGGGSTNAATTDDDGKFSFEGIRSGRFQFQISAQGYASTILRAEHIQQRQGEFPLEIILQRGKSTRGRVVDGDGVAISGAEIYTVQLDENMRRWGGNWDPPLPEDSPPAAISDANGDFIIFGLEEGNLPKLGAKAEGYGTAYCNEVKIDGNAQIQLPRHFLVAGSVVAGERGVESASVSLQRYRDDGEMDWGGSAQSDESGKFSFEPLAPGSYTLSLTSALGTIEEQQLQVTEDVTDLRLELTLDNLLTIQVHDADGQPTIGAEVSLAPEEQGDDVNSANFSSLISFGSGDIYFSGDRSSHNGSSLSATTDLHGVAQFASVPASRYQLSVSADGFATFEDPLEVTGTTQEENVELLNGGNLRVRIFDETDQAVVGIQVALRTADAEKEMRTLSTDAAGRAIWTDLEAGSYQVSYSAKDTDGWWWDREDDLELPVDHSMVKVKAGETTDFSMTVRDLALVTVHVTRHGTHAEDVKVSIQEVREEHQVFWGGNFNGTPTDGRGEVELAPVKAGEYEISVKASKASPATKLKLHLHVGAQRVEMELDGGAVAGKLLQASGALDNATVALASVALEESENGHRARHFVSYSNDGSYVMSNADEQSTNTRTDRYGNFEFTDIPDGQWQVVARAKGFGPWKSEPFTVQGGRMVQLGEHLLYPGAVIHGHDDNFVPPESSSNNRQRFGSQIRLLDSKQQAFAIARVNENGEYKFEDLPRGTYAVQRRRFTSEPLEAADGGTYRIDIPLEEPKKDK